MSVNLPTFMLQLNMDMLNRVIIPFKDRRFLPKAGMLFGLAILVILLNWGTYLVRYILQMGTSVGSVTTAELGMFAGLLVQILASVATIPIYLYQQGYLYEGADNYRRKSKTILPEHGDIKQRLTLGGVFVGIQITLTLPFIVVMTICFGILMNMLVNTMFDTVGDAALPVIAGSLIILGLSMIVMIVLQSVLAPAMMYAYLRERRFSAIYDFYLIKEIVLESWWKLLLVGIVLNTGVSIIIWLMYAVALLTCCLIPVIPLVQPLIQTAALILRIGIIGEIYRQLDETFKGTDLFERE